MNDNPHIDIAKSTKTFVLTWNDGEVIVHPRMTLVLIIVGKRMRVILALLLPSRRTRARMTAHDAVASTIWCRRRLLVHVTRKVDQVVEIWHGNVLKLVHVTLELGWDGWLHWHAVTLRR